MTSRAFVNDPRFAPPAPLARPRSDVAFWSALAIVPASVGLAVRLLAGPRRARTAVLAGAGAALGLGLFRWQLARLFTEQPRYTVEKRVSGIEVRRYPSVIRAVTTVRGLDWRAALDEGFRRLAPYIFGSNDERERIAMTAPVTTFRSTAATAADALEVSFGMPGGRAIGSLPAPRDARIMLVEDAPRHVAVLRYHGPFDVTLTRQKQRELFEAIERAGLHPVGEPGFAGYDPPSTLPLLRRNEVWIEVAPVTPAAPAG